MKVSVFITLHCEQLSMSQKVAAKACQLTVGTLNCRWFLTVVNES